MATVQRNGVDTAIALLEALLEGGGDVPAAALRRKTATPRASFHRIVRTLAAAGVVEAPRGRLRTGPLSERWVDASVAESRREEQRRASRPNAGVRVSGVTESMLSGPIPLSRPPILRSQVKFKIGFSNASLGNPWRIALVHGVEHAAAASDDRIERLIVAHAADDPGRQIEDIERLIDAGIHGLLVSAVSARGLAHVVAKAEARGITVMFVDRGVDEDVARTSFVSADDGEIGRLTAKWLAEILTGEGNIVLLSGDNAATPALARLRAAHAVFSQYTRINILAQEWTGWRAESGRSAMGQAIGRWGRSIHGVWCDSGLQGAGSMQAFIDSGRRAGEIPPHTGGDLNLAYKLATKWRVPLAAVDFPPSMGIRALEILLGALRGAWTPTAVRLASPVIVTKGDRTRSIVPDCWAEDHVRWDLPDDLVLGSGIGPTYNPRVFRIHYPGNVYNRSAAPTASRAAS
jgi:ribose transport system substrate-binding protein